MAYKISKMELWSAALEDRPGGLAEKLEPLAAAGADLPFILARRQSHQPGKGVVYVGGIKGAKATKAATAAGFTKPADMAALQVHGPSKAGAAAVIMRALADGGVNVRGMSAVAIGRNGVVNLAFDSTADADNAAKLIKSAGAKPKAKAKKK